jgi:hypothetical protein
MILRSYFIFIFFSFVNTSIGGQEMLTDYFTQNNNSRFGFTEKEQKTISEFSRNIFKKSKFKIKKNENCFDLKEKLNFDELEKEFKSALENKVDKNSLSYFLSHSINSYDFCNFFTYFAIGSNGLTIAESEKRNELIEGFEIKKMTEEGKLIFFRNYKFIFDSLYNNENMSSGNVMRVDSIMNKSRRYFHNKLSIKDGIILDSFWIRKTAYTFADYKVRDSIHKIRVINLGKALDSLEKIHLPILQIEADSILNTLDSTSYNCIKEKISGYYSSYKKKQMYNWDYAIKLYEPEIPNIVESYALVSRIMLKYPSSIFATSNWKFIQRCSTNKYQIQDNYRYLEFEKALSVIIDKYWPNLGMIYYSPYNRYTPEDIKDTVNNMLMYYLNSKLKME